MSNYIINYSNINYIARPVNRISNTTINIHNNFNFIIRDEYDSRNMTRRERPIIRTIPEVRERPIIRTIPEVRTTIIIPKKVFVSEQCVICLDVTSKVTVTLSPCGHKCLCENCKGHIIVGDNCPLCRRAIIFKINDSSVNL